MTRAEKRARAPGTRSFRLAFGLAGQSGILSAALLLALALGSGMGFHATNGIRELDERWRAYDLGAATKADALSELRSALGFGGAIHAFKDYIVSGDAEALATARRGITQAEADLDVYQSAATPNPAEDAAIETLGGTLKTLGERVDAAEAGFAAGRPRREIERLGIIEFTPAVEAMRVLNDETTRDRARLRFCTSSTGSATSESRCAWTISARAIRRWPISAATPSTS